VMFCIFWLQTYRLIIVDDNFSTDGNPFSMEITIQYWAPEIKPL